MNNSEFKENIERIDKSFMETYATIRSLIGNALDEIIDKAEDVADFSARVGKSVRELVTDAFDMMKDSWEDLIPVRQHRDKEKTLTLMETVKISIYGENLLKDAGCSDNLNKEISEFAEGCHQLGNEFASSAISLKDIIEKAFDEMKYGGENPRETDLSEWFKTNPVISRINKIMSDLQGQDIKTAPLIKLQKLLTAKDPSHSQDSDEGYIKNNPIQPDKPLSEYTGLELRAIKSQLAILRMSIGKSIDEGEFLKDDIKKLEKDISDFLDSRSYSLEDFISQTVKNDNLKGKPAVIQYIIQCAEGKLTPDVLNKIIHEYEKINWREELVDYKDTSYQLIPIYEKVCTNICTKELDFCYALKSVLESEYGKNFELKISIEPQDKQKKEKTDYSKE